MSLEYGNKEQKRLVKKYNANGNRYRHCMFGGTYMDAKKKRLTKRSRGKHSKAMKRYFNHSFHQKMRNMQGDYPTYKKGNPHKKITDYWNTMY